MKKLIFILFLLPNILYSQCFTNICNYMCDTCIINIVNIPSNQTFTTNNGTLCISGQINGNATITVNGANVCFKPGARFQGNSTINIISGNVCILEGATANPSANVNVIGGQIRDCSLAFNPTYNDINLVCICDSTTLPIINFYGYQYEKFNLLK